MAQHISGIVQSMAVVITVLCAACSSPERSRTLGDPNVSGKTIALQVCSTCHGAIGMSVSPGFPNLAGQQATYVVSQLKSFRSQRRSDTKGHEYMWGMSSALTDEQIVALGDYYAAQRSAAKSPTSASTRNAGQAIYEKGIAASGTAACITCHGAHAEGNAQFPRLAGQHADYLVKQLQVFSGTDTRPDGVAMKAVAHSLTSQEMKDVAAYMESL
jgi:cytochrome c553